MVKKIANSKIILITGGLGFLGSRIAQYLSDLGHEVLIGTRNIHTSDKSLNPNSLKLIETDWSNQESLDNACKNVNIIIHAAGMNRFDCEVSPNLAYDLNALGTKKLLVSAEKSKVLKFLYISTSYVYSTPHCKLLNENSSTENSHPYASSNLAGESFLSNESKIFNTERYIFRLSNAVGAPTGVKVNCWRLASNSFCRQIVETNKIVLNSTGQQFRDFIPISSVCKATSDFLNLKKSAIEFNLFNLSSGVSISILDLAKIIQSRYFYLFKILSDIEFNVIVETPDKQIKPHVISNKRLLDLGISIDPSIQEAIDETLIFCLNNFKAKKKK